ncbi:TPA: replication protein [Enterobacter hormaechei]|uniref:replication protein n=1 Tax=Enterobacter hormaechei TaxID=158836 RepID=UPI0020757ADB|nr:replication protein [Enterobacter hormaechei]HCD8148875.1 replication protein [Enterobacter hormaechei]
MGVVKFADYRPAEAVVERQVADLDDGFIMIAMRLYEELIGANLTRNQAKVAHAVCRKTYGFKKKMDRIADSQIAEIARISRPKACIAKNELISMKVLISENGMIGPNKNIHEWEIPECSQADNFVTKSGTKNVTKLVTATVTKREHTKDISKDKTNKTPLPPDGGDAGSEKLTARTKVSIDYESFLAAYNTEVGERLPHAVAVNEKRKRRLKKIIPQLKTPNVEGFRAYVRAFVHQAKPFYFGDNNTGWTADFDFLLRDDTLTGVREAKFADRGMA